MASKSFYLPSLRSLPLIPTTPESPATIPTSPTSSISSISSTSTITIAELPYTPTTPPHSPKPPTFALAISANVPDTWSPSTSTQLQILSALSAITREAGWDLAEGYTALETVVRVISILEDSGDFNCGRGATHGCDAALVGDGRRYGGVVGLKETQNPIMAARAVLEEMESGLKVGKEADEFARENGCRSVKSEYFDGAWKGRGRGRVEGVGVVVLDKYGQLAAGVSTGGTGGDETGIFSKIMVDSDCAVCCSGSASELGAYRTTGKVCTLAQSVPLTDATIKTLTGMVEADCSPATIIAVNSAGHISLQSSRHIVLTATVSSSSATDVKLFPNSILVAPKHTLTTDDNLTIGLTRYPICPGHTIATLRTASDLIDLPLPTFLSITATIRATAIKLSKTLSTPYIGLAASTRTFSLIPLHGAGPSWTPTPYTPTLQPTTHSTSQESPLTSALIMNLVHDHIASISPLSRPTKTCTGPPNHPFSRIIRCETFHHRIWENDLYVAVLDPYGGTQGSTLLIPRKQVSGGVFAFSPSEYATFMSAAHTVTQLLVASLRMRGCAVFFVGYEEGYAYIKLNPTHKVSEEDGEPEEFPGVAGPGETWEYYPGWLTTQMGPLEVYLDGLVVLRERLILEEEEEEGEVWIGDIESSRDSLIGEVVEALEFF